MPLKRRVPKRGFHNPFKKRYAVVNLSQLEIFDSGAEITPELLHGRGLIRRRDEAVKILGDGTLSKSLTVKAHGFSSAAKQKIEGLGGKAELIQHA
jgi:large subunit ribosomal protein L15